MDVGNTGSDHLVDDLDRIGHSVESVAGFGRLDGPGGHSVLAEDAAHAITQPHAAVLVRLDNDELPFHQPDARAVLHSQSDRDWRVAAAQVGKWPLVALGLTTILIAVFAAFISANGNSLSDDESVAGSTPAVDSAGRTDGSGRSTGSLGLIDGSGVPPALVIEPDTSPTGVDDGPSISTTTTTEVSTTGPSTTSTDVSSTTVPSTTTSTESTVVEPDQPWVVALGPGTANEDAAPVINSDEVELQVEGGGADDLRYRFAVSVWDDGRWRQVTRSRWRAEPSWSLSTDRLQGRTARWTVIGRTDDRTRTEESAALHFQVGDTSAISPDDVRIENGDFEQGMGGFDTWRSYRNSDVDGWSSSTGVIEVWADGHLGVDTVSGSFLIELNSNAPATLTQQVKVAPGMELRWSLAHRSRSGGSETIAVTVSPGGDSSSYTASGRRWRRHRGTYRVPDGVTEIDFSISSVTGGSAANLIDDVRLSVDD